MILKIREWCREESLGIVVPVGVTLLYVVFNVLEAGLYAFVYPLVLNVFEDSGGISAAP